MATEKTKYPLHFVDWLNLQTQDLKISKTDLMKNCGLSRSSIHFWEQSKSYPTTEHLISFCRELSRHKKRREKTLLREAILSIHYSLFD